MIEFVWLKKIDFFPKKPNLASMRTICLGTKSRSLGDALMLTALPSLLKTHYPHLKITSYPRAFNPIVLTQLPEVSGISFLPDAVYGDECNEGAGQIIQLKQRYLGLPVDPNPKPRILLTPSHHKKADHWIKFQLPENKHPRLVIHPFGQTRLKSWEIESWEKLIDQCKPFFNVIQVGLREHPPLKGCAGYFLTSKRYRSFYSLAALIAKADLFIGVDSGPMHIARAFEIPSLICVNEPRIIEKLKTRDHEPYHQREMTLESFLYQSNLHTTLRELASQLESTLDQLHQKQPDHLFFQRLNGFFKRR